MGFLKKPVPNGQAMRDGVSLLEGDWPRVYPALTEFLTVSRWEDDSPRVPGSVTLFFDDHLWKLCLNDKDSGRISFVTADSPEGVLAAAERGLQASSLDWRAQRPPGGRGRRN